MTILFLDYIFNRMQNVRNKGNDNRGKLATAKEKSTMSIGTSRRTSSSSSSNSGSKMGKRPGKRPGRKPSKIDEHAKLERSRQSARECRARKKLRYQYLEELVLNREKAVFALRDELETFKQWCSQMDTQGTVPESLIKLMAAETMEQQQRQMHQTQRALLQQKQHQHRLSQLSSSSSSGGSPPHQPQHHHQQQQQHSNLSSYPLELDAAVRANIPNLSPTQQTAPTQRSYPSELDAAVRANIPNLSPTQQTIPTQRSPPQLRRQMAIDDCSALPLHRPDSQMLSPRPPLSQSSYQTQRNIVLGQGPSQQYTSGQYGLMPSGQNLSRVKSEPPLRYSHSMESSINPNFGPVTPPSIAISSRHRSASNPISMLTSSRAHSEQTGLSSGQTPLLSSQQSNFGAGHSAGLFSHISQDLNLSPSVLDISSTAPIEVAEDTTMDNFLFQSSLVPEKRTLSDTTLHSDSKRQKLSHPAMTSSFDPYVTLSNLTTVHCFSATRTSNTPSPAPYGLIPVGSTKGSIPSPGPTTSYSAQKVTTTPSSSTTSSPAPLLSLNSFLELETTGSNPQQMNQPNTTSGYRQQPMAGQCSSTGLSASIAEPIPEWYSFLADLHDGGMSSTSRHGASSGQGTPMALTPKPSDQPATPDPGFMNVPNIIDDLLNSTDNGTNPT